MLNNLELRRTLTIFSVFLLAGNLVSLHIHPYRMYFHDLLVILGLVLMTAYFATRSVVSVRIPASIAVPFALIFVIVVQILNGYIAYPVEMAFPILYLICLGLALINGATVAMQEGGLAVLSKALAISFLSIGLISVAFQMLQLLHLETMPWVDTLDWSGPLRPYANYAQANTLALMLCFALGAAWYLFLLGLCKPGWAWLFAVLLLLGLALTQSRIGWIIIPLFGVLMRNNAVRPVSVSRFALLALFILYVGLVLMTPEFLRQLGAISESASARAGQTSVRLTLWQQAWNMSTTYPWLGVGWFQFGKFQFLSAAAFSSSNEYSDFAHNLILNFAAETGWPITLLLLAVSGFWIYHCCVKQWRNLHVRFISLMFVAVGVHSMVEFPLWYGHILIPVGMMIGALHIENLRWKTVQIRRGWFVGIGLVGVISMGVISGDYHRVVDGFAAMKWMQQGDKTGVGSISKPEWTLFPQYFDYFHIIEIEIKPGMDQKDLAFLGHIAARFSFSPVLIRLASAYILNQRPGEALQVLVILSRLYPNDYDTVYDQWREAAKKNPAIYEGVFLHMPKPASNVLADAE